MMDINIQTDPKKVQVFRKIMNKVVIMGVFPTPFEAQFFVDAFFDASMERLIISHINESMPEEYIFNPN